MCELLESGKEVEGIETTDMKTNFEGIQRKTKTTENISGTEGTNLSIKY